MSTLETLSTFPSRNLVLVMLVIILVLSCIACAAWIVGAAHKQARKLKAWQESVKPRYEEHG